MQRTKNNSKPFARANSSRILRSRSTSILAALAFAWAAWAAAGCHADPYSGQASNLGPDKPTVTKLYVAPTYDIDAPDTVELVAGRLTTFRAAPVATSGQPSLQITGLPYGAQYDPYYRQVSWNPPLSAASDPSDPTVTERFYKAKAQVFAPGERAPQKQKTIVLIVRQAPAQFGIVDPQPVAESVREGDAFQAAFRIVDGRFPSGPFTISADDLPPGASIASQTLAGGISLAFRPDFTLVKTTDQCRIPPGDVLTAGCKEFDWRIVAVNPAGKIAIRPGRWFVFDRPQAPTLMAPSFVQANNGKASFYACAQDVSGESAPVLTLGSRATPGRPRNRPTMRGRAALSPIFTACKSLG